MIYRFLQELVDAEAQQEIDQDHKDIVKEISKNFTIHDKAGNATIRLTRKFKTEDIVIEFHCQDEDDQFDMDPRYNEGEEDVEQVDGDDLPPIGMDFTVSITKGGNKVEFLCNATSVINIRRMTYIPTGVTDDKEIDKLYRGPNFDNLDEHMQDSLINHLGERGIDEDMAFFILSHGRDKEEREYRNWLKKMIQFIEQYNSLTKQLML